MEQNHISPFASRLRHLRYSSSNENTVSSSEHASSSSSSSLSLEIVTQGFVRLLSMLAIYFLGSSFLQIGVVGGKDDERRQIEDTSGSGSRVGRKFLGTKQSQRGPQTPGMRSAAVAKRVGWSSLISVARCSSVGLQSRTKRSEERRVGKEC